MRNSSTGTGQGPGSIPRRGEVWVHEKGLPRVGPRRMLDHLGHRMLLATDLTSASSDVHARAIQVAKAAGAHLRVLAIIPPGARPDASHRRRLGALVRRARRQGVDTRGEIVSGAPADAILRMAVEGPVDTIIIGDSQWRDWRHAGCVCGHVLLHSPCAVLVTHSPA